MRKRAISLAAAACLVSVSGCSGSVSASRPQAVKTSSLARTGSATAGQVSGKTADDGVVRASQQIKREQLGSSGDYSREVSSANYLVAQSGTRSYKVRSAPGYAPGLTSAAVPAPDGGEKAPAPDDFKMAMVEPLSTFSADVDTASYANLRRALEQGRKPTADEVRIEELINYFTYQLPEPEKGQPFSLTSELSACPWNSQAQLLRLAIKTKSIAREQRPPCNLVFLLDVSGSMHSPDKLPLLKSSLKTLVDTLDDADRIAIVTYAGDSGLALPSTPASDRTAILTAIDRLQAGGSTNGASGIELAYQVAKEHGTPDSVNRVILATDGDFNVGVSSLGGLKSLIEEKRKSGIFLSVLGFGSYGSNDGVMETLADNGNGNYAAIDSLTEARKVLVEESGANLVTVAKDVKFQIEFNPEVVKKYRLIGYDNRRLANEDFANDKKDAGDLGAGHAVTVLYEIIPTGEGEGSLKQALLAPLGFEGERLALVKMRYKAPQDDESELLVIPVESGAEDLTDTSADHRWATAVASLGLALEGDRAAANIRLEQIAALAEGSMGPSPDPYRKEFLELLKQKALKL